MTEAGQSGGVPTGLGLTEFLADLRADLHAAQTQAEGPIGNGGHGLHLGVEDITVTLEVAHVTTYSGEVSGKVSGKFWVFGSAEARIKGGAERQQSGTQTLTLTLRPRMDTVSLDGQGNRVVSTAGLDVKGQLAAGEQSPRIPPPPGD